MFKHVAGICTLTRYYSIALITHGRILILFGEMQPGFRSLPPLDAASRLKVWVVAESVMQMHCDTKFQENWKTLRIIMKNR